MKRHLHLAGKSVYYLLGAKLLLIAAVMVAIARFMPWLESHPVQVRAWLSQKAGRPVQFDALQAEWTRSGPLLKLRNMTVGGGASPLHVGDAELLVSQYTGWLPGRRLTELRIRGIAISLERSDTGEWKVHGLPGQTTGGDPLEALQRLGELQVIGGKLRVRAPSLGLDLYAPRVDVRTQVNGDDVRVGIRGWLQNARRPLDATMRFNRSKGDGVVFVGGKALDLSGQSSALNLFGVALSGGTGRADTWLYLKNRKVTEVRSDSDLRNLQLNSIAPDSTVKSLRIDKLSGQVFFQKQNDRWALQIPDLTLQSQGESQQVHGLRISNGDSMSMAIDRINLKLLAAVADLTDKLPAGLRGWLSHAAPEGSLDHVSLSRNAQGTLRFDAIANALGFNAVGEQPGVKGVSGQLRGDAEGVKLEFDPDSRFVFDWPAGFGVPHTFQPSGTVVLWREGEGMRVGTNALSLSGPDASVVARGGMTWQGDGTHPIIGIAAEFSAPVPVVNSHGFWVHHQMSKDSVNWLNSALVGGVVERGQVVVAGDLDDWPFKKQNGLFEAVASVRDFRLKFQPDWPEVLGDHALVRFTGLGMHIEATGTISGIHLSKATADIENLGIPDLIIHGEGDGDARQFLELIRSSPLQESFGEYTTPLTATGPASATVDLDLPLHDNQPFAVHGGVVFNGVKASHKTYELAFDNIRGNATYDRDGFKAEQLAVLQEGQPGTLALRVGSGTLNSRNIFEGALNVNATARSLLDRVPDLAWMKPHVDGRSDWTIGVEVPRGGNAQSVQQLELRSALTGTALNLPAPFNKAAGTALPTTVRIPLPMDGKNEIQVDLGNLANVRAKRNGNSTGVAIALGGSDAPAPPAAGVAVTGTVPALDVLSWLAFTEGGEQGGNSLHIDRFDVQANRLLLGDNTLPATRLKMMQVREGKRIEFSGNAAAGNLVIGNAPNAPIVGRLERLRIALPDTKQASTKPVATSQSQDLLQDPRKVPPLDFNVKSLVVGKMEMADVQLKTHAMPAGVAIDRFSAKAPQTQFDATGTWTGDATASRTALNVKVNTQNLGKLVDAMGAVGQVSKGHGTVVADLAWPAGPTDLQTANLSGKIRVQMKEGSLVKVEPGVGRVIGLFSVARLPRRLTLDFSDFFAKGFAFDDVAGDIVFERGLAKTDGFKIKGPAADIEIRGNANLESQTFDQNILVLPKTGNMLTVAGALTGGPIGAAIGAVAGQILKKPLGQMAAKTYHVTGPWSDPKVETVDKKGNPP